MRSVFLIREKQTQSWCYSSKHSSFSDDIEYAAIFVAKENAEKVIRGMVRGNEPDYDSGWYLNGVSYRGHPTLPITHQYTHFLVPQFEVVEFNLVEC